MPFVETVDSLTAPGIAYGLGETEKALRKRLRLEAIDWPKGPNVASPTSQVIYQDIERHSIACEKPGKYAEHQKPKPDDMHTCVSIDGRPTGRDFSFGDLVFSVLNERPKEEAAFLALMFLRMAYFKEHSDISGNVRLTLDSAGFKLMSEECRPICEIPAQVCSAQLDLIFLTEDVNYWAGPSGKSGRINTSHTIVDCILSEIEGLKSRTELYDGLMRARGVAPSACNELVSRIRNAVGL